MTVLMPNWYYEKKDLKRTPSIVDGIDVDKENRYRREGARFIINVGTKMGLRYDTMATGVVYFHRFYMFHSFRTFPRYVTACCCLFLAGKVEETPKKCKDIIRTAKSFLGDNQFSQFGDDPKEEVMTLERILLQTIKFDLQVDHPYGHLLRYAKSLKGDNKKLQNMVQMAWTFINDSLCTTLCLQWEPEVIAIALMYLAGKLSKFEVVDWVERTSKHSHWWDMFVEGMSIELLEDICHQVLDLYSTPMSSTPQDSPPATPPTKSTRKTSQPPSPVEASTSPAPQPKVKEPPVGLPIPRLEPGELKRKVVLAEAKKEVESKIPRIEGKAIPTISSAASSPPPLKKVNRIKGTSTQPSSPTSPKPIETVSKVSKHVEIPPKRNTLSDATFRSGISATMSTQSFPTNTTVLSTDTNALVKPPQHVPVVPTTTFTLPLLPPTATYTQTAPPFFTTGTTGETPTFPNIQQPPPQIFSQQPMQFQHPPPSVAPSTSLTSLAAPQFGEPPHQYPTLPPGTVPPPFNAQFPPPTRPPNMSNPPPTLAPGLTHHPPPPIPGLIRGAQPPPPPPPGVTPRSSPAPPPPGVSPRSSRPPMTGVRPRNSGPRLGTENVFNPRPGSDMYRPRQEGRGMRPLLEQRLPTRDFGPRSSFDDSNRFNRPKPDYDSHFQHNPPFPEFDQNFHRPLLPNQFGPNFERPMGPRRFPLDLQQHRNSGPRPRMMNNMQQQQQQQQQGTSTGIPPVRITGSM
ncbi:cyclin-K isoform X4 [Parasteatoda tepidariorum]|nr:cyclin-K isoform X3 [Parasteatoda tepidariorum]XP_042909349.1 cyclin-K isoform X3 [Parasteatoda tepidariorum]